MPAIRDAATPDTPGMVALLVQDCEQRYAQDPDLWAIADGAPEKIEEALKFALEAEDQPFRQKWLIAESDGRIVGIAHSMRVPAPPIYAGKWGEPGLLLPDCVVADGAPAGTREALVEAAESDLRDAGAQILLASSVSGDGWRSCFEGRGYRPLTLYLAKTGLGDGAVAADIERATEEDVPGIVERSAENRTILAALHEFWTPHAEANARFGRWMRRSLALTDRNMFVARSSGAVDGYAIAQPASRLHFPAGHDISRTGVLDDYYHTEFADPLEAQKGGQAATALLKVAENALAARGANTAMIVCPAAWRSKISILEDVGYQTAMVWMMKH